MFKLGTKGKKKPDNSAEHVKDSASTRIDPEEGAEDKSAEKGAPNASSSTGLARDDVDTKSDRPDGAANEASEETSETKEVAAEKVEVNGDTSEASEGEGSPAASEPPPHPDKPWRLAAAEDLSTAYLDYAPNAAEEMPVAAEILEYARALGVPDELLFSEEILSRALQNTINSGIPLKAYAISEDRDAGFEIVVSTDKLKGELSITKAVGRGVPLDLKKLGSAIRASGLKGLKFEKIKKDILEFYRGTQRSLDGYVLAEGSAPEPAKPQEITWEIDFLDPGKVEALKQKDREAPKAPDVTMASLAEKPVVEVPEMAIVVAESIVASLSAKDSGKPGMDVFGSALPPPGDDSPPVQMFEHLRLGPDSIVSEVDGILDRWPIEEENYAIRIRPYRDATVDVNVSEDAMLASVKLVDGIGSGTFLSDELVRQALIDAGVVKGIDMDAVSEAVRRASEEGDNSEIVVAHGQPPTEPGESRIKFQIPFASDKGVTIRSDGTADFKNQDRITTVSADQLVAEIITVKVEISDGWDIRSKIIKGSARNQTPVQIGDGIRTAADDSGSSKLYAERDGELVYDGNALSVLDIHTIPGDVGPASGNVKFGGSVNITGSVRSGYFIMSKGTVKIAEGVEAGLVSADETIHIEQGVKGGGKAVLRARQAIYAGFIELATVMAASDVTIQNTCLNSTVKCNGKLSLVTDKGRLVGGQIRTRNGVSAAQIGSRGGVSTTISFGQDYLIGDKIELEEREIEKLQRELVRLEGVIHAAERENAIADVKKGRARKLQALKLLEKRTERLFWLRERFEQYFESKIEVRGTIFPGVAFESHGRTLEITHERQNVVFYFDQDSGHIVEKQPERKDR